MNPKYRPLTLDEFEKARKSRRSFGRPLSEEMTAVQTLEVGQGLAIPCRWKHTDPNRGCGGARSITHHGNKVSHKYETRCKDGTLYLWRRA